MFADIITQLAQRHMAAETTLICARRSGTPRPM
jgi:hypothetical protein